VGLARRIDRATLLLYTLGIFGLVSSVLDRVPYRAFTWITSGIVMYALQLEQAGNGTMVPALKFGAVFAIFALAYAVHRRMLWGAVAGLLFVAFDGAALFIFSPSIWSELSGSLQIGFHVLVCWSLVDAGAAMRQWTTNEGIARRLDVEAALKRKLEDSEAAAGKA